jgi:hypothetical protein
MSSNIFDAGTPLSALFKVSFHTELVAVIEGWRSCLIDDDTDVDALQLNYFKFDKHIITAKEVYGVLLDFVDRNALVVPMSLLALYLSTHSNLSTSYNSLYQQMRKYHSEWS